MEGGDLYAVGVSEGKTERQSQENKIYFGSYFPGSYLFSDQKLKLFTKSRFSRSSTGGDSELGQSPQD